MIKNLLLMIFAWWHGTTFGTWWFSLRKGVLVGSDELGNRYYRERKGNRRWVIYKDFSEASQVPAGWHGWLHHRVDETPVDEEFRARHWHKPHQANATGTNQAYRPAGSILRNSQRPTVTGDYNPWSPAQD